MRMRGINTNSVDYTICSNAAGKALYRLNRVLPVEIDDFSALVLGHFQSRRNGIDGENAPGIQQLGAGDYKLPDRTASEDCHRAASVYAGDLGGHPCCGNDVGKQDCLIIADAIGNSNEADIRKGNACILGLEAVEWSSGRWTTEKCCARLGTVWIRLVAL